GVRVRRWVTFHGISLNVDPDLGHFAGIVPCGIDAHGALGVTSLHALGHLVTPEEVDCALIKAWDEVFGTPPSIG
ncbi:MAG TPA: lipoate-protein ligase B, partial [Arenibaculum sp.]|nr:lipoate-protein ligase B [Arenibaculum sp.]